MSGFKCKFLAFILTLALFLSMIPMTAIASSANVDIKGEQDLIAAIDEIPQGGSGVITIKDINMILNEGIYIEGKDVTFNLVNTQLVTSVDQYGGQPVIFGYGANITINADENSSMQSQGHTGVMGVVRVDNSTDWNDETKTFEKDFTVTINGGKYTCAEGDSVFVAASGTKVVLTDVVCNGNVEAVAFEGVGITVPGELTINSGRFTNDVSEYVADGKFHCNVGHNYYVRDKEWSDTFSSVLTDGKIVFDYVKPTQEDDSVWLIAEEFCCSNPDFYLRPESFTDNYTVCEIGVYMDTAREEIHAVEVVWNYDDSVLETAQSIIEKFPENREWFNVTDLELVNYWVYRNPNSEVDTLANYSGELKSYLGNSNFLFPVEDRAGSDEPFYTERIGSAKLMHDGKVYFSSGMLGARAEHAIYVSESTEDSKDALIVAAQKSIDDYIGKDIVKITADSETVQDYYNGVIAEFDARLSNAQNELVAAQSALNAETSKAPSLWDQNLINQCNLKIMECEGIIRDVPIQKQYFINRFEQDGDLHFLESAAGGFVFNVEVRGDTYKFVIIKDDEKIETPSYATVDLDTNIQISASSSEIPLDTVIKVEKLTKGTVYDKIINILDVEDNETFDIKLHSGSLDKYLTKLANGKFEVKIPVPERFKGKELVVYYVDESDNTTQYEVTVEDNFATFITDHFSIYTLAEASDVTEGSSGSVGTGGQSSPQTGDNSNAELWIVLAILSGGCLIFCITLMLKDKKCVKY